MLKERVRSRRRPRIQSSTESSIGNSTHRVGKAGVEAAGIGTSGIREDTNDGGGDDSFAEFALRRDRNRSDRQHPSGARSEKPAKDPHVSRLILGAALGTGLVCVVLFIFALDQFQARRGSMGVDDYIVGKRVAALEKVKANKEQSLADLDLNNLSGISAEELRAKFGSASIEEIQQAIRDATGREIEGDSVGKVQAFATSSMGKQKIDDLMHGQDAAATIDKVKQKLNR